MMRVLGVNGTPGKLWLALVSDGERQVLADGPTNIALVDSASIGLQLRSALDEAKRAMETYSVDRVRILDAESKTRHSTSYSQSVARVGLEAAIVLAADELGVGVARVNRTHLRSLLGFSSKGELAGYADSVLKPAPPHWRKERDLAALVALAGLEE